MNAVSVPWRKIISFAFWGILTTALNVGLYYLFRAVNSSVQTATVLAWFLCVLFAYITNKRYVFKSRGQGIVKELLLFYGSRLFSGILDVLIMSLFVTVLHFNEIISKIADEIIISAFNFMFSFLVIFKSKAAQKSGENIHDENN